MRVVVNIKWTGITPEQYNQLGSTVKWEENIADGGVFHIASFDANGMRVTDIWESPQHFQAFVENRLMPGVTQIGVTSQPEVEVSQLHRVFAPALAKV